MEWEGAKKYIVPQRRSLPGISFSCLRDHVFYACQLIMLNCPTVGKFDGNSPMAHNLFLILFVSVFITGTSCRKDNSGQSNSLSARSNILVGSWELRRVRGTYVYTYQPGNGNEVVFGDSVFTTYVNGVLNKTGHYDIIRDNSASESLCLSLATGDFANRLVYDSNYQSQKIFFDVTSDSLITVSGCFAVDQGAFNEFVRMK